MLRSRHATVFPALLVLLVGGLAAQVPDPRPLYDETAFRTFELRFAQADWWQQVLNTLQTENYVRADLIVEQRLYKDVGVRARGFSSTSLPGNSKKMPLRIALDAFQPGQELLGYDTLKLNNGLWDPSMVRDVLALHLYRRYIPAPKANFVNLTINGQNWGVYSNIQSVDGVFAREAFGTNSGNRYEAFGSMRDYGPLAEYQRWFLLRSPDKGDQWADVIALTRTYASTSLAVLENDLQKRMDIDHFYRHMAAVMLTGHTDSSIEKDYYLYNDPFTGLFHTVPWDCNLAMRFLSRPDQRPSHANALRVPAHRERFLAHLRVMVAESLDPQAIVNRALAYQALIDSAVAVDPNKFYTHAEFRQAVTQEVWGTPSIQTFANGELAEIRRVPGFGNVAPSLSEPVASPNYAFRVRAAGSAPVRVTKVSLFLRNAGPFVENEMFDDGNHGDGAANDGIYGLQVPAPAPGSVTDHYFAAYDGGTVAWLPATAGHRPFRLEAPPAPQSVLIHEVMADNENGVRDEKGQREDWLELFNPTRQAVDLSGAFLTDNRFERRKWALPANTVLAPGKALLVWADEDLADGPLHADFKLSKDGEELALYAADGRTLLDHVAFGPQQSDVSTGRVEDRVSPFVTWRVPTPGVGNDVACGVRAWSALNPTTHTLLLGAVVPAAPFLPRPGATVEVRLDGAPPHSSVLMLFALAPGNVPLPDLGVALLLGGTMLLPIAAQTDAAGRLTFPLGIPQEDHLVGAQVCMQALGVSGTRVLAANGVAVRICP